MLTSINKYIYIYIYIPFRKWFPIHQTTFWMVLHTFEEATDFVEEYNSKEFTCLILSGI